MEGLEWWTVWWRLEAKMKATFIILGGLMPFRILSFRMKNEYSDGFGPGVLKDRGQDHPCHIYSKEGSPMSLFFNIQAAALSFLMFSLWSKILLLFQSHEYWLGIDKLWLVSLECSSNIHFKLCWLALFWVHLWPLRFSRNRDTVHREYYIFHIMFSFFWVRHGLPIYLILSAKPGIY